MKLKSLTIALALAATSASSFAAEKQGFYIGAFGDYYDNSWENVRDYAPGGLDVDDSTGWGLELGYRFSDYWSARLEYADMDFDWKAELNDGTSMSGSESGKRYGIDGLYHFGGGPFYGIFGLKNLDAVDEDLMFANVGAGYQHYFTEHFAFNAETSLYQGLDRGYTDVGAKLGLSYIFGAQSAPAEPVEPAPTVVPVAVEPVDSDGDNIPDA
ncbi:MAG: outer membrane beta-barrel protein, partial [Pseudomonadota bacterium]|nr:outer membrane beta-barrel protein [Pseudomonadota bacterium]